MIHGAIGLFFLMIPALVLATGVATVTPTQDPPEPAATGGTVVQSPARIPATFGSSDISDWYAPDNETIVINTYGHGRFKGKFMNRCQGVRFAETLGFATMGPYELDASTRIVLPDGSRCALRELVPFSDEEDRRAREEMRKSK